MLRLPLLLALAIGSSMAQSQFSQGAFLQQTLRGANANRGQRGYCNIACSRIYIPVCGDDGKTYPNSCVLDYYNCAFGNVTYAYAGECDRRGGRGKRPCPLVCPYLYAPVCGSDGATYPNRCTLDAAICKDSSISLRHNGACDDTDQSQQQPCPTTCPFDYAPVCGNDGNTYANLCTFQSSACTDTSLRVVANGPCGDAAPPRIPCPASCRGNYDPVCGSDDNTYGNRCTLDLVSCRDPSVTLESQEECGAPFNICPDVCHDVQEPVCGSDGVTYRNECVFRAATCKDNSIAFTSTAGECAVPPQSPCPVLCSARYNPVCGTDGKTYPNQCVLESEACHVPFLATASQGECLNNTSQDSPSDTPTRSFTQRPSTRRPAPSPTPTPISPGLFTLSPPQIFCPNYCGRIFSPVCGTDRKTYFNQCLLALMACREQRALSVAYLGVCRV